MFGVGGEREATRLKAEARDKTAKRGARFPYLLLSHSLLSVLMVRIRGFDSKRRRLTRLD